MKKAKNVLKGIVLMIGLSASFSLKSQVISPMFYGQNAWMPDTIGNIQNAPEPPVYFAGKLHQNWGNIQASGAGSIRFGGIAADKNIPTNFQYIKMIDSIRNHGMEPIIQVPYCHGRYSAQQAADIVRYINIVRGKNVKYWSIGNEPDLGYNATSASHVSGYIKSFASAMKAIDPTIKIMGPETAWFNTNIINGLTTPNGPDDITGRDAMGNFYVDFISFHFYGFDGAQTRQQVIGKITSPGGFADNLATLNSRLNNCNTVHNRTGLFALKSAVTEANVGWRNPTGDNVYGNGANSFLGGQFIAEMYGAGIRNNVAFINVWSVIEGGTSNLNIGYLDHSTNNKKASYYHYKMMAENMRGFYLESSANNGAVKTIAAKNGQNIVVMIMNTDQAANLNFTVRLNNSAVSGNNALKINVNGNVNAEYNGLINNQSSILLVFNSGGGLLKKVEYTIQNAANNQAPTTTNYGGAATAVDESSTEVVNLKGFHINLYPNPANSKFTIGLDRRNPQQQKFNIQIFDLMGRLVHQRQTVFFDMKQELDLSGSSLAEAVYIVRVFEDGDKDNVRSEKIILFK